MSNFSFSHSVFKRLAQQTRKNQGLFGKGLTTLKKESFENILGKVENAGNHAAFCPVPKSFSTCLKINFKPLSHLFCCLQVLSFWTSLQFCRLVNLFPNKPVEFICKRCGRRRNCLLQKLLIMSNFSFPTMFSIGLKTFLSFSSNLILSSANSFSVEESKICCLGKG